MTGLAIRHFATTIGDGVSTSFTIHHGLNTKDVFVQVMDADTFELDLTPTITVRDPNTVQLDFSPPKRWIRYQRRKGKLGVRPGYVPQFNQLRVLVSG